METVLFFSSIAVPFGESNDPLRHEGHARLPDRIWVGISNRVCIICDPNLQQDWIRRLNQKVSSLASGIRLFNSPAKPPKLLFGRESANCPCISSALGLNWTILPWARSCETRRDLVGRWIYLQNNKTENTSKLADVVQRKNELFYFPRLRLYFFWKARVLVKWGSPALDIFQNIQP